MPEAAHPPDLVIALSRDKVSLQLAGPGRKEGAWQSSFSIPADFMEDGISSAMDSALAQEDGLIDSVDSAEIVVIDRPGIFLPRYYDHNGQLEGIASKYLRIRPGDTLVSDHSGGDILVAYSLPAGSVGVLHEYYAGCGHVHIISVLWTAISDQIKGREGKDAVLFFIPVDASLVVMASSEAELIFAKTWPVREESDAWYYAAACYRMLRPKELYLLGIANERPSFDLDGLLQAVYPSPFIIDQKISLPTLHELIGRHRSCVS